MKLLRNLVYVYFVLAILAGFNLSAVDSDDIIVLKGALVYTAAESPINNATILIENGRISAVGQNVTTPLGAKVIDVSNKIITPGFIDVPCSRPTGNPLASPPLRCRLSS